MSVRSIERLQWAGPRTIFGDSPTHFLTQRPRIILMRGLSPKIAENPAHCKRSIVAVKGGGGGGGGRGGNTSDLRGIALKAFQLLCFTIITCNTFHESSFLCEST